MKLREVLAQYDDAALESLAADKIDDLVHLRLPKEVLVDELAETIASYSYVASAIARRHPPCFEILDLLMKAEGFQLPIAGFKTAVLDRAREIAEFADSEDSLALEKDYELYVRMLEAAWETNRAIDASESSLLTALRRELKISFREHVVLEHGARVRSYWSTPDAYELQRNHLLEVGIFHTHGDCYVLPEEFPQLIRDVWSIELPQVDFRRLLDGLTTTRLYELLAEFGLKVAGSKEERIERLVTNYVEPRDLLGRLTITELRDLARNSSARISGHKDELIDNLLEHFLRQRDLEAGSAEADDNEVAEPEPKALEKDVFERLFREFTLETLYEMAGKLGGIRKSGSKPARIEAFWKSSYAESTLLRALTNASLVELLRGLDLPTAGPKDEKVARLLDWARSAHDASVFDPEADSEGELETTNDSTASSKQSATVRSSRTGEASSEKVRGSSPRSERFAGPPEGYEEIQSRFGFLDPDQQTVLAALRGLRSLNEHELERLVARYDLDWFLTKAQMLELMETLAGHGTPVVEVRSRGEHNVYEYVGD